MGIQFNAGKVSMIYERVDEDYEVRVALDISIIDCIIPKIYITMFRLWTNIERVE